MTENQDTFAVVFRGDIVIGENLIEVKQRLQKLFNVDDQRIDGLFIGKPVQLKKGLSKAQAHQYIQHLKKAGILAFLEKGELNRQPRPRPKKPLSPSEPINEQVFSLRPLGALPVTVESEQPHADLNLDHLSLAPAEGNLMTEAERQQQVVLELEETWLEWELSAEGGDLLAPEEKQANVVREVDIAHLSIETGQGDLLKESEKIKVVPVIVNTDHLILKDD